MTPQEMKEIMFRFKEKHPNLNGLNITEMRKVLDGDLVIVPHSGTRKFLLMTPAQVAPGGKLDQMNAEIRAYNQKIREINRQTAEEARRIQNAKPQ